MDWDFNDLPAPSRYGVIQYRTGEFLGYVCPPPVDCWSRENVMAQPEKAGEAVSILAPGLPNPTRKIGDIAKRLDISKALAQFVVRPLVGEEPRMEGITRAPGSSRISSTGLHKPIEVA